MVGKAEPATVLSKFGTRRTGKIKDLLSRGWRLIPPQLKETVETLCYSRCLFSEATRYRMSNFPASQTLALK